jgi:Ca2+-binding RTX toxin-like protein
MKGNAGSDEMEGGLGADKVLAGLGNDNNVVWGGEQKGSTSPFTYPDKSNDLTSGGRGSDQVYGGFGQGGIDKVLGNQGNDNIVVAQRGFPPETGKVKVTKEVVDCGKGEDTVYRDKRLDIIANNCEHKFNGYPVMMMAARGSSPLTAGPLGAASAGQ